MNERIKLLAEQCTSFHTDYDFEHGYSDVEYFDKEKFAELIVRECANFSDKGTRGGIGELMKKHFGVEE